VTKYEGLFILNLAGTEDSVKDAIDRITAAIGETGGRIETVQKMDKRNFSRVTDKKVPAGFYVNFIFNLEPAKLGELKARFQHDAEVYRALFTRAPKLAAAPAAA
jgi:ribosomal protein S6